MVCFGFGIVAQNAHATFVGAALDAEDDGFSVGVGSVAMRKEGRRREREVVERFDGARRIGRGGCHDEGMQVSSVI